MSGFTSDSPQISASQHQLDIEPYALGSYIAQWNAPGPLHDKHMLCSIRILQNLATQIQFQIQVKFELKFKFPSNFVWHLGYK